MIVLYCSKIKRRCWALW